MKKYPYILLCSLATALASIPAMAQPASGRFGFKGLDLGMTRLQIDSLLEATPWQVMYPTTATVAGHTDPAVEGELLHGEPGSDVARLGCNLTTGNDECLDFETALFMLDNGRIGTIIVTTGDVLPPNEQSLQTRLGIVTRAITAEYGAPVAEPREIPVPVLRALPAGESRLHAQWKHPGRFGEQIEVKVQRSRRKGYFISIVIMDAAAAAKNKS